MASYDPQASYKKSKDQLTTHSDLKLFTGLAMAALMD